MSYDQPSTGATPRVGPRGILTLKGSTFALTNFSISIGDTGEVSSTIEPKIAWEIWPIWLRIAMDHEALARSGRAELLTATGTDDAAGSARAAALESETRAGLVTMSASAFAIEAMSLSAGALAGITNVGSNTSSAKRACETLKQCFDLPKFSEWRNAVVMIFKARNDAVHPDAGLRDPMSHPALNASVPWTAHVYRLENAKTSVDVSLHTALVCGRNPKQRHGKDFRERVAAWNTYAEDLRDHRASLA